MTVTNARHHGQSAPLPTGGYVPVDVNHASLSAPVGVSIGAAGTAGGAVAHDGASPSPLQADDPSSFSDDRGRNRCRMSRCVAALRRGGQRNGTASPATESMTVTTDKADYAPGSTATFIVTGVNSGSSVAFQIADLASDPGVNGIADVYAPFSVTEAARAIPTASPTASSWRNGKCPPTEALPTHSCSSPRPPGSQTATTTFTDAPNQIVSENQKPALPRACGQSTAHRNRATRKSRASPPRSAPTRPDRQLQDRHGFQQLSLDIYRLGYYGGKGARQVTRSSIRAPATSRSRLFNDRTNAVDAGNWSVSASWAIRRTAVSGVYFAKLTTDDGNFQNKIPFIVRNDGTTRDILFQTRDTTWQAYNPWGGYNLYQGPGGQTPTAPMRSATIVRSP